MGLPEDWTRVESWLNFIAAVNGTEESLEVGKKKNPEIPVLADYSVDPGNDFWKIFPSSEMPVSVKTKIVVDNLQKELNLAIEKGKLTKCQQNRAQKAITSLRQGADSCQKTDLPACVQPNAKSAVKNGEAVTDTVATWVKKGFAAGPFKNAPLDGFRVNCLMAIPQHLKVRPVLNASLPENNSLNSNVKDESVEKVEMCSARCFSYSVVEAGKGAFMSKMDMEDAYKNVPCKLEDLRLQGFMWLNNFFVETRQIFGATTAVCNFDILGKTVLDLVMTKCEIPSSLVHRQLDDVPVVVPYKKLDWCKNFIRHYRGICEKVNISLAQHDPKLDKAFDVSQFGKVLGIIFDTTKLIWSYPDDKKERALCSIGNFLEKESVSLLELQVLMGRLNDISLMCPFLRGFKGPLNELLGNLQRSDEQELEIPAQCKKDVMVWAGFLLDIDPWFPIAHRPSGPPISKLIFTSDAAGFSQEVNLSENMGVASIGFDQNGTMCFAKRLFWPQELREAKDEKGGSFGNRTVFLEMTGLLLPLICCPEMLAGKHVVLKVDNLGCYYGWQNKSVSNDKGASILVRAIHLISSYLECCIYVEHLPRMSSWEAEMCDRMSREKTTLKNDETVLSFYKNFVTPGELVEWLKKPTSDWGICSILLERVKEKLE